MCLFRFFFHHSLSSWGNVFSSSFVLFAFFDFKYNEITNKHLHSWLKTFALICSRCFSSFWGFVTFCCCHLPFDCFFGVFAIYLNRKFSFSFCFRVIRWFFSEKVTSITLVWLILVCCLLLHFLRISMSNLHKTKGAKCWNTYQIYFDFRSNYTIVWLFNFKNKHCNMAVWQNSVMMSKCESRDSDFICITRSTFDSDNFYDSKYIIKSDKHQQKRNLLKNWIPMQWP